MKPISFKEQNCKYAENQPQYLTLPSHRGMGKSFPVTSCWELSLRERIKLLFTGKIWVTLLTFGQGLMPQKLEVDKPNFTEGE